ncbi:hypothetical protein BH10PSE5_BH10PSE5_27970 [soil metagenome]
MLESEKPGRPAITSLSLEVVLGGVLIFCVLVLAMTILG